MKDDEVKRKLRPKRLRPKRSYRAAIHNIRQVLKISQVNDQDSISEFGNPSTEFLPEKGLRIAVWNICKGMGKEAFRHELQFLMRNSDLLLVQEALLTEELTALLTNHHFHAIHGTSYIRRDGIRDGVLTLSRSRTSGPIQRILCKSPEPILKTAKTALLTPYLFHGGKENLIVVNLHAKLIRSIKGAIHELRHLLLQLPVSESPMVLAGDFNTFTKKYLRAIVEEMAEFGLMMVEIPDDPRGLFHHLDHVFIRGLSVKKAEVDVSLKNSDHFPLVLTLDRLSS